MAKDSSKFREFALVGARARLEELRKEEAALRSDFPELFRSTRTVPTAASAKRGRPAMTAAQKKAVSERMKKYWADRRKKSDKK